MICHTKIYLKDLQKRINIRLDNDLYEKLRCSAEIAGLDLSEYIRTVLRSSVCQGVTLENETHD